MFLETTGDYVRGEQGNNLEQSQRSEPLLLLLRTGFLQTGAPFGGQTDQKSRRSQVAQTLSYFTRAKGGDHQLKFGWDFNRITLTGYQQVLNDVEYSAAFLDPNQAGVMSQFFQLYGFQQSAARFFTLSPNPGGSRNRDIKTNDLSGLAQDAWRVRPNVTLNAGLRTDQASLGGADKNALAAGIGLA